ncbi:hypothetical protein Q6375_13035 [Clostridium septicum]|uniref:hypothetical protein n=1 Tax=Clostridium septicum TaxID=1504 RepID=UPI00272E6E29|nr:hypothetical protein [Clostridium septicum]WLF68893.1 hypothetical protein Q6375_13035 [Clostridium septicum]
MNYKDKKLSENEKFNIDIDFDNMVIPDLQGNIDEILDKGLKGKRNFFSFFKEVKNELGFKNIFHDKSELIFIGLILSIAVIMFGLYFNERENSNLDFTYKLKSYTFITAPIIYFFICSYNFINSRLNGTYEIQATCKYNFYTLTAIRMFIFSVISMVINTAIILIMFLVKRNFNVVEVVIVSITSLFIFSVIYILALVKLKERTYKYLVLIVWIGVSSIIMYGVNSKLAKYFLDSPIYINIGITCIVAVFYIKNLKKLIKVRRGEV